MKHPSKSHSDVRRSLLKSALALASLSACGRLPTTSDRQTMQSLKRQLAIRNIEHVWIPLRDGRRLAARIWMPVTAEENPVPAILEYLPYRKRDLARNRQEGAHVYAAARGYAGVRVDIQGSGESDGILKDEYEQQEQLDGLEVLRWLAQQSWCTGAVGMRGISWGGFNSLQIAALNPPELKAIITHCSTDDRYADDAHYIGGSLSRPNWEWGQLFMGVLTLPPDPELYGPDWRKQWLRRIQAVEPVTHNWVRHQRRDSYWEHGSVCEDYSQIQCPVYAVGGFVDGYTNAIPRLLENLEVPRKGLIGPYGHNFPDEAQVGPAIGFFHEEVRWWDQWLKGIDTGMMDEPMLKVFMQKNTAGQVYPDDVAGRWVAEAAWPSTRISDTTLYLNARGLSSSRAPEKTVTLAPDQTVGLNNPAWLPFAMATELPRDQSADDAKSLTFDSQTLDGDLEICGHPVLRLSLSADKPIAKISARLNEIRPDGTSWIVTQGYLNLTHRNSHANPETLQPGKRYEIEVPLNMVAFRFKKGHQIRVALSESYWPTIWPSPEPVALSLHTGVSELALPTRPPGPHQLENLTFASPAPGDQSGVTPTDAGEYKLEMSEPDEKGAVVIRTVSDTGGLRINETGTEMRMRYNWNSTIERADPNSAQWSGYYSIALKRADWNVRTLSNFRLTSDVENFHLITDIFIYENEEIIFSKEWKDTIARDLA